MAVIFEYLVLKTPSDAEVVSAGSFGWELVLVKGNDFWFKREVVT